jgi:hypothetical protein
MAARIHAAVVTYTLENAQLLHDTLRAKLILIAARPDSHCNQIIMHEAN